MEIESVHLQLTSFSFNISLNCLTRVSSGTSARSLAARTSASMAASLPMSFFLSVVGFVGVVVADVVAGVVAVVGVFVLSVVDSASLGFLVGTSPSVLDSDSERFVATAASSDVVAGVVVAAVADDDAAGSGTKVKHSQNYSN